VDLSLIGPWIVFATAIPAFVVLLVSVIALRGTDPKERPEIIRALAELFQATRRLGLPTPKNPGARGSRRGERERIESQHARRARAPRNQK
jgi:hypothetical protein